MVTVKALSKKDTIKNYSSVIKHNNLIQGKYSLEATEQKWLYKVFESVQKNGYTSREVQCSFNKFFKEFKNVLGKNITKADFKELVETVQDKKPYIIMGDEFIRTQWYKIKGKVDYSNISLIIDEDVFKYIQSVNKNCTYLRLESLYSFKSFYSMRIYELIKQWCNTKMEIPYDLESLKELLGLEVREEVVKGVKKIINKSYDNFNNFDKYVLKKSIDEINEKSEITIEYKPYERKGKKITSIMFEVEYKEGQAPIRKVKELPPGQDDNNEYEEKEIANMLPEGLLIDKRLTSLFIRTFNDYDFTDLEYYSALMESMEVALRKDNVDIITAKNFKVFKGTLDNKIETVLLNRAKESLPSLTAEEYGEMRMLGMEHKEYVEFMKELGVWKE